MLFLSLGFDVFSVGKKKKNQIIATGSSPSVLAVFNNINFSMNQVFIECILLCLNCFYFIFHEWYHLFTDNSWNVDLNCLKHFINVIFYPMNEIS